MAVYPSKRDLWLMLLLWLLAGLMVFSLVAVVLDSEGAAFPVRAFAIVFFFAFTVLSIGLVILPHYTFYDLGPDSLAIRVGPVSSTIPLEEISEAYPTHNPLSAPAWSLDRIRIRYESSRFGALISPEHGERFLAELELLAPHLERSGKRLVRKFS